MHRLSYLILLLALVPIHFGNTAEATKNNAEAAKSTAEAPKNSAELKKSVHKVSKTLSTTQFRLPNGLTVFLTENKNAPSVVVSHWVKAGSLHEAPGTTGIAHLFEHMMFRPLKPGAPTFFDIAKKLGGDLNANTRFESTYYYTAVPPENLSELLKYEADRFKNLVVTKELLDVERKAVWSEYSTKFDANPVIDLWFQIYHQGFQGHPFGWTIVGAREDLEKITAEHSNAFFQKFYRPNNIGLFVTGNFNSEKVSKEIVALYGDWKAGEDSQLPQPFTAKTKQITGEGKLPAEAKAVLFGFRTPYLNADNAKLQTVVDYILFDAKGGLFKKRLVDDKRLAARVDEFNFDYDNGMMKGLVSMLPNSKLADVKSEIIATAADFKALTQADFDVYKRNLFVSVGENVQRNIQMAQLLALTWGKYGNVEIANQLISSPLEITKAQADEFMATYFKPDNFVFVTHKGQNK